MEHELIDYYDENGRLLGVIDKAIAHREGLWHKSVHLWIFNSKNQVLLQKRCAQKKFFPGYWDVSVAGHISAGENSIDTSLREAKEEIGLNTNENEIEFAFTIKEKFKWKDIQSNEFVDVYILNKDINLSKLKFQKEEVETVQFVDKSIIFSPNPNADIFPHYEEYKLLENLINEKEKDL